MRRFVVGVSLVSSLWLGARVAHAEEPLYTCKERTGKISATFAPETEIKDLATWLMGFTCKNVVIDADVLARVPKVTILAPNAMTTKQAMALFVDAVEATGLEVVVKKDTVIIKLGANMPKTCPSVATTTTSTPVGVADVPPASDPDADALAAQIDAGIKKVDDTTYVIARSLVDAMLANPMALAKGARVVPAVKNGKPDGFKLYAIRPSSVYAKLGFMNGDTLRVINGFALDSADKALEVYTKLREAKSMEIELTRRGKPVTLKYTIK